MYDFQLVVLFGFNSSLHLLLNGGLIMEISNELDSYFSLKHELYFKLEQLRLFNMKLHFANEYLSSPI